MSPKPFYNVLITIISSIISLLLITSCNKKDQDLYIKLSVSAGSDILDTNEFSVFLNADSLKLGETGVWLINSGLIDKKVFFVDKHNPKSQFYGLPGQGYELIWRIYFKKDSTQDIVNVRFKSLTIDISESLRPNCTTRFYFEATKYDDGQWTLTGDYYYPTTQMLKNPQLTVYGLENGNITATWTTNYGSVSASKTITVHSGEYSEYEALEDLKFPNYKEEDGHVIELYMASSGSAGNLNSDSPALKALKYVRKLLCSGNLYQIKKIPSAVINYMPQLHYLDLSDNYLTAIPDDIKNLKMLDTLILDHQQGGYEIKEIPEGIGECTNLIFLDLSSNSIARIPDSFGNLVNLKYLRLDGSSLDYLPSTFGNLASLELFYAAEILSDLPESFSNLTNLKVFSINERTIFSKLPTNIGNLKKLECLELLYPGSYYEELPESFSNLQSLKTLKIASKLKSLSPNFDNLKNLEICSIFSPGFNLPECFYSLPALKYLRLSTDGQNLIPFSLSEEIIKLVNIENIELINYPISTLPNNIGSLDNLQYLRIYNCQLDSLPLTIGNLKSIYKIDLTFNNLGNIPKTIKNLSTLRVLILTGNKLDNVIDSIRKWFPPYVEVIY